MNIKAILGSHINASANQAIIGSDNGLSPDPNQAIIKTNIGLLLVGYLATNCSEFLIEIWYSLNEFENDMCRMAAILSQSQFAKSDRSDW